MSAFEQLYKKYAVQLLRIAMQKTNDRETSKEFVQETFITLFKHKDSADTITSLLPYLYVILKNRILDKHRHDLIYQAYQNYAVHEYSNQTAENDVQDYIESKELEQRLMEEIEKLPPQCGNVFKLRREQELSNKQVAALLNISENTVEQHMRKALRLLRIAFHVGRKTVLLTILFNLSKFIMLLIEFKDGYKV